jgi:sugar phosphate isomerase/epimerase
MKELTRRDALVMAGSTLLAAPASGRGEQRAAGPSPRPALTLFSRHLHWAGMEEAVEVAASAGFGSIAWTVRPTAHIAPQKVSRDLPKAVELTRRAGLGTPLIVTSLRDADSPYAQAILETATGLGIRYYRAETNSTPYNFAADLAQQLEALRPQVASLARLNERYGATALLHNHGGMVAGAVWDTWMLVRDHDPARMAINFDTGYGMMWAGRGCMEAVRFAAPYIRSLSLKDFRWRQDGRRWNAEICIPGRGMVDFQEVLGHFASIGFHGPAEVQFEYPVEMPGRPPVNLMGYVVGQSKLDMPKSDFIALLKRDAGFYAARLRESGLAPMADIPHAHA